MTQSAIATAADYADAMITARKAKNVLFVIVLLMLVIELSLFFVCRYRVNPADATDGVDHLKYLIGGIGFLGVIIPIVLCIDLLLIVMIMLVGRLIGVSHLVAAFLWCVILTAMLFPWQAILINQTFTSTEFKIPGVLYTWAELLARVRLHPLGFFEKTLFWGRFVAYPVAAIVILVVVQATSRRGLRLALGEAAPDAIQPTGDA